MSKVILWSDLHLGHKNVCNFRKEFSTPEEHDECIFDALRTAVGKRDIVYLLGDVAFTEYWLCELVNLNCQSMRIVLGNHDTEFKNKQRIQDAHLHSRVFDEVHGMVKKGPFWLTHAPIHPQELRGRINIHGHTHYENMKIVFERDVYNPFYDPSAPTEIEDSRYINICPEQTNWKPVVYQNLIADLKKRGVLPND